MLSRDEARAWAEIERRLAQEHDLRSPLLARLQRSVPAQTVTPLPLAVMFSLLGLPVPAFFFLFLVPVGLIVHMARNSPPPAKGQAPRPRAG
ncbi:MAG: hypothetical protein JWR81_3034 [Pseudonocardia sp.]|jgi:hypothetical protein|nr:hypothetical protein [Pseudonocardia sp.]MDT7616450.1 hypothetical protein [Pseudonocardiales bacterium]